MCPEWGGRDQIDYGRQDPISHAKCTYGDPRRMSFGIVECAGMSLVEIILAQFAPPKRKVTLLCQGYCGSEFRAASLSWVGISHTPDPKGTLGMPEEMTSSAKGAEGCPGGARGIDLIKSARVESCCRRGRRSSRGKFPERFRGRRGRPRCRGLG